MGRSMQQQTIDFEALESNTIQSVPKHGTSTETLAATAPFIRPDRQITYQGSDNTYEWPSADSLHDRNTITVDRVVASTIGPSYRFLIKRGDTVNVYFGASGMHPGVVTGISHAKHEVRVALVPGKPGAWHKLGCIYPAPEPQPEPSLGTSLSACIDELNSQYTPEGGFTEAEIVYPPYTLKQLSAFRQRVRDRSIPLTEFHAEFETLLGSKEVTITELQKQNDAKTLKSYAAGLGVWDAARNTKAKNAQAIFQKMLLTFTLDGVVSHAMHEEFEDAVATKVREITLASFQAHYDKLDEAAKAFRQTISDPQTLSEFSVFIRAKGEKALSLDQFARWDRLHADQTRERAAKAGPSTTVTQFAAEVIGDVQFTVNEGYHSKRDCKLWIVSLSSRVDKSVYKTILGKARELGGWYSSFIKDQAGFQFLTEDAATKFTALLDGDVDPSDALAARKQRKELTAAERLHALADTITARAEETIAASEASLQNTARRADMQAGIRGRAYSDQALARTMHSVAEALSTGNAKYLDGIRHKTHVETLETVLRRAKGCRLRSLHRRAKAGELDENLHVDEEEENSYSEVDVRFADYPHPYAFRGELQRAIAHCQHKKGVKQAAAKMLKIARSISGERLDFTHSHDIGAFTDFVARAKGAGYHTTWLEDGIEKYKRLQAASIADPHELRMALREYLSHRSEKRGDDPVQVAERELIGIQLPGFFPTPRPVIEEMLQYAELGDGMRVLEPSCGKGDILDSLRNFGVELALYPIEKNLSLADVLAAKGYAVDFCDFLNYQGEHDRILMNPPFEVGQDIDHVRHAYTCLAPAGKLVSIMSEGPFFRGDKKSTEFRQWLDQLRGQSYELPEDAFNTAEAFRQTGVKTRIVVIDKT